MDTKIDNKTPITLVELPPTQYGILNGELSSDEYSHSRLPSRAIDKLAAILETEGFSDVECINPCYNGINNKLSSENFRRIIGPRNSQRVLGLSALSRTAPPSIELARLARLNNPEIFIIAGGNDPTYRFEEWLGYVDVVVRNEGEKTFPELLKRVGEDKRSLDDIDGIAFKKGSEIIVTKDRTHLTPEEFSNLPHPKYDEKTRKGVSVSSLVTSVGCPHDCDFCTVTEFYGRKYRFKSVDYVVSELRSIYDIGKSIFIVDDNFGANPKHTIELCNEIYEAGLNKKFKMAQLSIKAAKNPGLLKALKRAGIGAVCLGIESINDESLQDLGKFSTAEENKEAVKTFREYGIRVHGMMMPGADGDTVDSLEEMSQWAIKNLDTVQYFPPQPIPGTRFCKRMKEEGRILSKDYSLYDGHAVVIRPKNMTPYEHQMQVNKMCYNFYSLGNNFKRLFTSPKPDLSFKFLVYTNFMRGVSRVLESAQMKAHLEFLKSVS